MISKTRYFVAVTAARGSDSNKIDFLGKASPSASPTTDREVPYAHHGYFDAFESVVDVELSPYSALLKQELGFNQKRLFHFGDDLPPAMKKSHPSRSLVKTKKPHSFSAMPAKAERIVAAPGAVGDFYTHVLDYAAKEETLAVGLREELMTLGKKTPNPVLLSTLAENNFWTGVKFSPCENFVAAGDSLGGVRTFEWNAAVEVSEKILLSSETANPKPVNTFAWHPLQKNLLVAGRQDGRLLFFRNGQKVAEKRVPAFPITLEWNAAGTMLAAGSQGGALTVLRFDLPSSSDLQFVSHHQQKKSSLHRGSVRGVAWSPVKQHILAAAGFDGTVSLWDLQKDLILDTLQLTAKDSPATASDDHASDLSEALPLSSLLWAADGRSLLVSSHATREILRLEVNAGLSLDRENVLQAGSVPGQTSLILDLLRGPKDRMLTLTTAWHTDEGIIEEWNIDGLGQVPVDELSKLMGKGLVTGNGRSAIERLPANVWEGIEEREVGKKVVEEKKGNSGKAGGA